MMRLRENELREFQSGVMGNELEMFELLGIAQHFQRSWSVSKAITALRMPRLVPDRKKLGNRDPRFRESARSASPQATPIGARQFRAPRESCDPPPASGQKARIRGPRSPGKRANRRPSPGSHTAR